MLNIRQLSQLLGISTQTIRLYEQHGIFHAERSESNNYRKFDNRAIATLMKCRKLMGMGFGIKQVVEISKGVTYQEGQRMLKQQADEIEQEIRMLVDKRKGIAHMFSLMRDTQNKQGTCEIVMAPELYRWPVMRDDKLLIDKDDPALQKWNEYSFLRHDVKRFPKEVLMEGAEAEYLTVEYSAKVEDALRVGLDVSKAYRVEAQPVLMAYATCPANQMKPMHEIFSFVPEYIREHNLTITADPILFLPFWPQQGEYENHFVMGIYVDVSEESTAG